MQRRAVYPGSFDPITFGHMDLIKRALRIFDEVIVACARDTGKPSLFTAAERRTLAAKVLSRHRGVRVEEVDGLVVDYIRRQRARVIIRGLRMLSDFEYEFQMALTYRKLDEGVETLFLMPSESYSYVSSRLIKEAVALGADVSAFVPPLVARALKERLVGGR